MKNITRFTTRLVEHSKNSKVSKYKFKNIVDLIYSIKNIRLKD